MERGAHRQWAAAYPLLDISPHGVLVVDPRSHQVLHANPALARLMGRPADMLVGHPLEHIGLWIDAPQGRHLQQRLAQGQAVQECVALVQGAAGHALLAQVDAAPAGPAPGAPHVYHLRPLLGQAQEFADLNAILATAPVGIAFSRSLPAPRHFIRCNPVLEEMFGWSPGELIGRETACLWPSPQAYRVALAVHEPALLRGHTVSTECTLRRKDGSTFACLLRARVVTEGQGRADGTVVTFEDLTQHHAQEAALAAAVQQAEAANRAKSVFVANLSHEIRNPLAALLGLAHLAHAPDAGESERALYLRHMLASALVLKDLLDNTLDFAKMEAGMLTVAERPFEVQPLLDELAGAWRPVAAGKGLAVVTESSQALPRRLVGDATRIRQILSNFVSNAIKFSDHGAVRIRCVPGSEGMVRFQVVDQGPGLGELQQARLFQRFVQLDNVCTATGTGLGLSICRDLARRMGGEVGVDSRRGQGACFWLQLPLSAACGGCEPAPGPAGLTTTTATPTACPLAQPPALGGARLLLVEDDEVNQMITSILLERWGAVVEVAGDGESAVARTLAAEAAGCGFDAVLMDLRLPRLDGIAATRRILNDAQAGVLIVGLSASALQDDIDAAVQAGMAEVLSKPFDPAELCARLQRLLRGRRAPQFG